MMDGTIIQMERQIYCMNFSQTQDHIDAYLPEIIYAVKADPKWPLPEIGEEVIIHLQDSTRCLTIGHVVAVDAKFRTYNIRLGNA